jgi:hypothetical protein
MWLLIILVLLSGCSAAHRIGVIYFPDSEVHYISAYEGNHITGSMKVIDRYQHSYSDNKTVFLKGDSQNKDGLLGGSNKPLIVPFPIP